MKKLLIPIFIFLGLGAGVGGGMVLRPPPSPDEVAKKEEMAKAAAEEAAKADIAFVKMNNQFIVPIVRGERVSSLVVLSLSLQTNANSTEALYKKEPKLRDAFLRVLFDHSYSGGFNGAFASSPSLDTLRRSLLEAAHTVADEMITDILITDFVRQDA
ncbi:flagellar basal body-associated FliL family protein [Litoreibacter roseus]|uniref:Flagellar protein FliL n=1 Tax=Litoreibacter roseus TaxID=2601869 RepID=A0A6N6JEM7_9RHOB|nr:flagellar basal body-associated FliL family protein [Litoreibacter roseus]GFE64407.1 flagellar basal body-associated protein FliL [Litoreibacter roseus]